MEGRANFCPSRSTEFTKVVYGGVDADRAELKRQVGKYTPGPTPYKTYFGEIHGHTELSDGRGTPDAYFTAARDLANLDFCALTDHDHGGVCKPELWVEKWDLIQDLVAKYHEPGKFVTILGYERDSFPFYPNACLYYKDGRGEMVRSRQDGEITRDELIALLNRDDIVTIPHQISQVGVGVNFRKLSPELMPTLVEIYSKWGASEFFGNERPIRDCARGNYWQDALECGARVGCVGGSDVHAPYPGIPVDLGKASNLRRFQPGIAAVLTEELTREAIFEALQKRRCYACEGVRAVIDFRINGAHMGSEIDDNSEVWREIHLCVTSPEPIEQIDIVKNAQDHFRYNVEGHASSHTSMVIDLESERETDYYYVRVTHCSGLRAWSSPIWVKKQTP